LEFFELYQRKFSQHFLAVVFVLQFIMYFALFTDLPLVRIIVGIGYLTFVPGFVAIKLLRLDRLGIVESVLFAVGFSLAFLMIAGLIINSFGASFGLNMPLSTLPISLFVNTLILVGAAIAQFQQQPTIPPQNAANPSSFSPWALILVFLPILSIIGTYFVNLNGNSSILMLMITIISLLFIALTFLNRRGLGKIYPVAIFMIALALLFHFSLISGYIVPYGGDSPVELFVFRNAQMNSYWYPVLPFAVGDQPLGRMNAMLSVTILPTVYSNMLGLDPTWVYKIIYPIIFAFLPVALYMLWKPYIGKKYAFLAAFLFMAQSTFYTEMMALSRQLVAELFFVLLFMVLLNKQIRMQTKYFAFIIFSFGLIFSHYALSEIFLVLIFTAWAASMWLFRRPSVNLQLGMVVFFFVAMFGWYIFTSGSIVFDSFVTFTNYVYSQLGDFFNPLSRGSAVLTGLGLAESPSLLNTISRGFAYLTELFILIGIVGLITRKTRFRFDRDYAIFALIAMAILAALTIVPGLANTLNMTRFYHILLMLLAPFCIVGIWMFVKFLSKKERPLLVSLLVVAILVPYFLFQTNYMYEAAKTDSWSIPLSGYRMNPLRLYGDFGFIDDYSVTGAVWLHSNIPYQNNITADNALFTSLTGYGLVYRGYVTELRNDTILHPDEYIYLSYISINYEKLGWNGTLNTLLNQTNVIYSNGGSEVRQALS
jgi:uncharacterized membrane protein